MDRYRVTIMRLLATLALGCSLCPRAAIAFEAAPAPCLRMTEADASQAFGTVVKRAGGDPCRFEVAENRADYFTLEVQPGQAQNSEKLMEPLRKIFGNPDPVSGVGDRAFSYESVLIVIYKQDYFTVSIFSSRLTRAHTDLAAARLIALRLIAVL